MAMLKRVIIEIKGGAPHVVFVPEGTEVHIVDIDAGVTDVIGPGGVLKDRMQHHAN